MRNPIIWNLGKCVIFAIICNICITTDIFVTQHWPLKMIRTFILRPISDNLIRRETTALCTQPGAQVWIYHTACSLFHVFIPGFSLHLSPPFNLKCYPLDYNGDGILTFYMPKTGKLSIFHDRQK